MSSWAPLWALRKLRLAVMGHAPRDGAVTHARDRAVFPIDKDALPHFENHEREHLLGGQEIARLRLDLFSSNILRPHESPQAHAPLRESVLDEIPEPPVGEVALKREMKRRLWRVVHLLRQAAARQPA